MENLVHFVVILVSDTTEGLFYWLYGFSHGFPPIQCSILDYAQKNVFESTLLQFIL